MSNPETVAALLAELTLERYGPPPQAPRAGRAFTEAEIGGSDTDIATARRRRDLCDALDDADPSYQRRSAKRRAAA